MLISQDRSNGPGHVWRGQGGGCDLVEQRLEAMMVLPVDHGDVDPRPCKLLGRLEPSEAAADNDDARQARLGPSQRCRKMIVRHVWPDPPALLKPCVFGA